MNQKNVGLPKAIALTSLAVLMSLLPFSFFLSTPFLRVLRKSAGAIFYWCIGVLIALGFFVLQADTIFIWVGAFWITQGLYLEMERKGFRWELAGLVSVGLGTALMLGGGYWALAKNDLLETEKQKALIAEFLSQLQSNQFKVALDPQVLIQLAPSLFAGILILVLGFGLIFEKRAFRWFSIPKVTYAGQANLYEFRVPDFMIWIALSSILLALVPMGPAWLGVLAKNLMNIAGAIYFFQGLAVLEVFMIFIRAGLLTRVFTYFFIVGQILPALSVVGIADFWMDFRRRMRKVMMQNKLKTNEE